MCLGDWRVGRLIRAQSEFFTVSFGATRIFGANKQRVGVSIGVSRVMTGTVDNLTVRWDNIDFRLLRGDDMETHISITTHGDLPMRTFSVRAGGSAVETNVIQYFLPESFLTAGIEEFQRQMGTWEK